MNDKPAVFESMCDSSIPKVLWVDCLGGLIVGVIVVIAHRFLADWYNVDASIILFTGIANLAYGSYSLFLATRRRRAMAMVKTLAIANIIWAPICFAIVYLNWPEISWLGVLHLIGEGIYVGGLGFFEWRLRNRIASD